MRHARDFERAYARSVVAADGVLVVNACENDGGPTRLGLSVSRKVGGAVCRNRWKRLIREAFRQSRATLPPGLDLVVRPKRGATPDGPAIAESLPRLAALAAKRLARSRS